MDATNGPRVVRGLDAVTPSASVVTIGNFDGVHRGHQVLLRRAVHAAADLEVRAVAVTFDPHPAAVLRPGTQPQSLQPLDERVTLLHEHGIDLVVVLPFTLDLASWSPETFVTRVLVERLRCARVVVGTNFRFGHRAAGDVVTLVERGDEHGFGTEAVTLLDLEGQPISSSTVRERLAAGDVDWVTRAMGRVHELEGEVVQGDQRGRTIGFPTANLDVADDLALPGDGVYTGETQVDGRTYRCVTNIGVRPTFAGDRRTVETHLLDADLDLYGRRLRVGFARRLRGERRFSGVDELVAQIERDVEDARSAG